MIETETKKGAKWDIAEKRPSYRGVHFARPSVRPSVRVFFVFSMSVRVFFYVFNVRPRVFQCPSDRFH